MKMKEIEKICTKCNKKFKTTSNAKKYCPSCRSTRVGNELMFIGIIEEFDAAHKLCLPYESKCVNIHGHRWKVCVEVCSVGLTNTGMVMDFSLLKKYVRELIKQFDHTYINDILEQPTSENMIKYFFKYLRDKIDNYDDGVLLSEITIWETPTSYCKYNRKEYIGDIRTEVLKEMWRRKPPLERKQIYIKASKTKKEKNSSYKPIGELNVMNRLEVKEAMLNSMLKSIKISPNKLEQKFINVFKQNNLPFKYVGDGKVIIGGKIPDFINEDKKKIIEINGEFWHTNTNQWFDTRDDHKERIAFFKDYGYDCLIIWGKEIEDKEQVIKKVKQFSEEVWK